MYKVTQTLFGILFVILQAFYLCRSETSGYQDTEMDYHTVQHRSCDNTSSLLRLPALSQTARYWRLIGRHSPLAGHVTPGHVTPGCGNRKVGRSDRQW